MNRTLLLSAVLSLALLGPGVPAEARVIEDAVYVYDLFQPASGCKELSARLRQLPLRPTVILSIEQGPEFLLDRPEGNDQLSCVLRFLRRSSRQIKALFLQAPGFLRDSQEAVRRAALLGNFIARHPRQLAGAQVDVEPYTEAQWMMAGTDERRKLLQNLHELLLQVRPKLRGLPLGVAIPWWYSELAGPLPEAAPEALSRVADELYLMTYGDEGQPIVGNVAARLLAWIVGAPVFSRSGRMHVVLATYEFPSQSQLEAELKKVRRLLASRRNFAGTALFHANSGFAAPPPVPGLSVAEHPAP